MTQPDIETSSDEERFSNIMVSDDEDDLLDLRQMALLSMIKSEKVLAEDNEGAVVTVYDIERQLKECRDNLGKHDFVSKRQLDAKSICSHASKKSSTEDKSMFTDLIQQEMLSKFKIDKKSSFITNKKRLFVEDSSIATKRVRVSEVQQLVEECVGKPLNIGSTDKSQCKTYKKQPELKNKLLDLFKSKNTKAANHSDDHEFRQINDNVTRELLNDTAIPDRYTSRISDTEKSIDEIAFSIDAMMVSIHEKLQRTKAISAQMEAMKRQRTELHKEINVTRRKILDLNKVKKQRIVNLAKYKDLRFKFDLSPISSSTIDKTDLLNLMSLDCDDYRNTIVDCNQIICPLWILDTCVNKHCGYQHPKIATKPVAIKKAPIKENDKVFLSEMNPLEFLTTFQCEACCSRILLSNLHIVDDWHCKSCCQQIMILTKSVDILGQLINIWHHNYKRYLLSQNVDIVNRDVTVLNSLLKCTDALYAKIVNVGDVPVDLVQIVGRHILVVYSDCCRTDNAIDLIKTMNYDINLVLFFTTLSFPVASVQQLIADAIDHKIQIALFVNVDLLVRKYCQWCAFIEFNSLTPLFNWLELVIKMSIDSNYGDVICTLTKSLLTEIMGSHDATYLNFSLTNLQCDRAYWVNRKKHIRKLLRLYVTETRGGQTISPLFLVLLKYRILSLFFTDNEEKAITLCHSFTKYHFLFKILLSEISLKYNYPLSIDSINRTFVEHHYNKAEWLLWNRSNKSCITILESIVWKIYGNANKTDSVRYFEHFLRIEADFDHATSSLVPLINESKANKIRETSSVWMCYLSLSVLKGNRHCLTNVIVANSLWALAPLHLCRVFQLIFRYFAMFYDGEMYCDNIKSVFLRIEKCFQFDQFMDLFKSICFENTQHCQLSLWLFLVDFTLSHYNDEQSALFLTEMSSILLNNNRNESSYEILSHIMLCYHPIKVEKVWLNFIQLILRLSLPLHVLLDVCCSAVSCVRSSQSLWHHYYNCAQKIGDEQLIASVKEKATKIGFSL